jgi:peptidoglycan/xylan/chitin deacetylase (PgdA/CDA1 family)
VTRALAWCVTRGVGVVRRAPRPGLRVLLYHSIGGNLPDAAYGLSVAPDVFERQMQWLRQESSMEVVGLAEGVARLTAGLAGTAVAVTFDDGYRDTLERAAPMLARYGIPFTVFVVGGYLGRSPVPGLYLDRGALRELAGVPGASIGAHGHTHRPLTRLPDADLREELHASAAAIADVLGGRPDAMSYPHGAVDARVSRAVAGDGFRLGATSLVGVNDARVPPLRLRRTEVTAADDVASFAGKIHGDYDWYRLKQRLYWPVPEA